MSGSKSGRHFDWQKIGVPARIGIILAGVVAAAGFFVLAGFIVVWLWNWLMPVIFRLPQIGFWQAWGLLVLSSILFKRHPSASHAGRERRRKQALRERMHEMGDRGESGPESVTPGPGEVM
ncbi:MAG TPA: hypothetical protein VMW87_02055 [Spirochaetia bacterium]|nr:hypothetical protein [Spirochaetia bacterium]